MAEIRFTESHEWLSFDGDTVTIGITDHAQDQLGDIVFIDLPEVGQDVSVGDELVVIESVKAAGEVNAAIAGSIIEVNESLKDEPTIVNTAPTTDGWMLKIKISETPELSQWLTKSDYEQFIA